MFHSTTSFCHNKYLHGGNFPLGHFISNHNMLISDNGICVCKLMLRVCLTVTVTTHLPVSEIKHVFSGGCHGVNLINFNMAIDHTGLKPTLMSLLVLLMYSIYVAKQPVSGADPGGAQGASVPPSQKKLCRKIEIL